MSPLVLFHQLRSVGSLSRPSSPPGRASMWRSTHPDILKTSTNSILKTSGTTITKTKDGDSASVDPSLDLLRCFGPTPSPSNNSIYLPQGLGLFFDVMIGDLNWSENYKSGLRVQRNGTLHGSQLGEPGHFMTSLNTISSHTLAIKTQP